MFSRDFEFDLRRTGRDVARDRHGIARDTYVEAQKRRLEHPDQPSTDAQQKTGYGGSFRQFVSRLFSVLSNRPARKAD